METQKTSFNQVKEALRAIGADSVARRRSGSILVRKGFFYRSGGTADKWAKKVTQQLSVDNIAHKVLASGEKWTGFRGGASVAKQSHWYVEIELL